MPPDIVDLDPPVAIRRKSDAGKCGTAILIAVSEMRPLRRKFSLLIRFLGPWHTPVIGLVLGFGYGVIENQLDIGGHGVPYGLVILHDIAEYLIPAALGAVGGLLINYVRRQARLNRSLSTQNTELQRQFFTQTLSAHILHELRNPLHNLAAVIEGWQQQFPKDEAAMLQRNLDRLRLVTEQLSRWHALDEALDLHEATPLRPWVAEFLADQVHPQLERLDIAIEHRVEPVTIHMHPLLVEQCLTTLLNNALEAASRGAPPRSVLLSARMSPERENRVEVELRNTGALYPEAVLAVQGGEPIRSPNGLGLGLVLVRRGLEQVGGLLRLENQDGQACTTLWIPGQCQ